MKWFEINPDCAWLMRNCARRLKQTGNGLVDETFLRRTQGSSLRRLIGLGVVTEKGRSETPVGREPAKDEAVTRKRGRPRKAAASMKKEETAS